MSISINKDKCVGCRKCANVCPGNLIKMDDENRAFIKYPKDCWGCTSCIKECDHEAISFFLGADIGGMGSKLTVNTQNENIIWNIEKSDGERIKIEINPKDANKY
jgi:adenylylsulfate reductase subunit B